MTPVHAVIGAGAALLLAACTALTRRLAAKSLSPGDAAATAEPIDVSARVSGGHQRSRQALDQEDAR
jgi:hypothetical protein